MERAVLIVAAEWDDEAKVWVATSDDVPGLVTEAASLDALHAKLAVMVPELLELNAPSAAKGLSPLKLVATLPSDRTHSA
jgi:predicted RNase H-like HicB family nuclease